MQCPSMTYCVCWMNLAGRCNGFGRCSSGDTTQHSAVCGAASSFNLSVLCSSMLAWTSSADRYTVIYISSLASGTRRSVRTRSRYMKIAHYTLVAVHSLCRAQHSSSYQMSPPTRRVILAP